MQTSRLAIRQWRFYRRLDPYNQFNRKVTDERALFAPSLIPCPVMRETLHKMDRREIKEFVESYARTAGVIKEAGFDSVEFHSSLGGYLIAEFFLPIAV